MLRLTLRLVTLLGVLPLAGALAFGW